MKRVWNDIESLLHLVSRPGRYTGNEIHAIRKDFRKVDVTFALAFPDVYEIGMSHLGLGILYHILNREDWIAAERVFAPWVDFEGLMRAHHIPLFSLESKMPVRVFDILGITLQYELHYTNILNLLSLSGVALYSADRTDEDPFVIGGGPCAFNPEPLAPFFDAFVLGDGEEIVLEVAEAVRKGKERADGRESVLHALAGLEGVYVPSFYIPSDEKRDRFLIPEAVEGTKNEKVRARILGRLDEANYTTKPVIPLIEVTHDRYSMEIMRGCTRGCRFCNAGMIYRPVRERSVDGLVSHARDVISNTGYDEISLVSLSTSDYSGLPRLLEGLKSSFSDEKVSISFPSLRPDTFTPAMAEAASSTRRGGVTLAPEAGTQRLRDVINKNSRETDLLRAAEIAFERGWRHVKLYFMIGLPTETKEDIQGIVDLVGRIVHLSRKFGRKEISVSISPFSPKPHTPFQWQGQDSPEQFEEKLDILRRGMTWRETRLNWRDPRISRLETILGRGDRRLAEVIERVWKAGARFEAWSDRFDPTIWDEAFHAEKIVPEKYIESIETGSPLPWDHLTRGMTKSFLLEEREKALSGKVTEDCRSGSCRGCGLMDHPVCGQAEPKTQHRSREAGPDTSVYGRRARPVSAQAVRRRVRIEYQKGEFVRFTSHLDTMRLWIRALKRAGMPLAYSEGFHAHPKFAAGPPLPLGFTSLAEYADLELVERLPFHVKDRINKVLPEGMILTRMKELNDKGPSLNKAITHARYTVTWKDFTNRNGMQDRIDAFLERNVYRVQRMRKGVKKRVDIRHYVAKLELKADFVELLLRLTPGGTARVTEVIEAITPAVVMPSAPLNVVRIGLYIEKNGRHLSPIEAIE